MGMGDVVLLDIQELICSEAFSKIPNYGAQKLKQHEHQQSENTTGTSTPTTNLGVGFQSHFHSCFSPGLCKHSTGPGMGLTHLAGVEKPKSSRAEVLLLRWSGSTNPRQGLAPHNPAPKGVSCAQLLKQYWGFIGFDKYWTIGQETLDGSLARLVIFFNFWQAVFWL